MLEISLALSLALLFVSVYFNVKFGIFILKTTDAIEECLDSLDERYISMSKILEKPVFFDSVEIRQVIQEIRESRDLILRVANKISGGAIEDEKEK